MKNPSETTGYTQSVIIQIRIGTGLRRLKLFTVATVPQDFQLSPVFGGTQFYILPYRCHHQ